MIRLRLLDSDRNPLQTWEGEHAIQAVLDRVYRPGDCFEIEGAVFLTLQLDPCLDPAEVYAPEGRMHWPIPMDEQRLAYSPQAFQGARHLIRVRETEEERVKAVRPISRNSHDLRGSGTDFFPHATANIETRGEACFAARNVIDGLSTNAGHGEWPYGSWGIGTRQDAALTLDFGRRVSVKTVRILSRADFPHDSWFESVTVEDHEGMTYTLDLKKTAEWQSFPLSAVTERLCFRDLKKADDPSPFPSLRGIEVLGEEI